MNSESVSLPMPNFDGMSWRSPEKSDASVIVALQDACCDVDLDQRLTEVEVLDWWADSSNDPTVDALLGFDASGQLVVSIWSLVPAGAETKQRIHGYQNQIHPSLRTDAMNEFVLDWWQARGCQRLSEIENALPAVFIHYRLADQLDEIEFLTSHGYEVARYFHDLIRDLAMPIPEVGLPNGITVQPLADHITAALRVHNDSFRDHWGSQPMTPERWQLLSDDHFEPDSSFVAFEHDDPVAYIRCGTYPQDFGDRGWTHTWIEGVGTARSHRRRGLASALATRAMLVIAAAGIEYAILGVDAENPTGAYGVYERLGFREVRGEVALIKTAEEVQNG